MPPRRTTYQPGRVGMVNIPNVDFMQYKAQANVFSDLERRLNAVTDFAIKSGTQDALTRASEDMYQNSVLRNVDLESMQSMTKSEFDNIVGNDNFTAYGKQARKVATEILQTNLALDAQTMMDDDFTSSSLANEDSEELWKTLSGRRDGYVSAYLESTGDYEGAYAFGSILDKNIRSLTDAREKEIVVKQKQDNIYNYKRIMEGSTSLIGFDNQDPWASYDSQVMIHDMVSSQNDMGLGDRTKIRNLIDTQFYNSIADLFTPAINSMTDDPEEAFRIINKTIDEANPKLSSKLLNVKKDGSDLYDNALGMSTISALEAVFADPRFDKTKLKSQIYNMMYTPIKENNDFLDETAKIQQRRAEEEQLEIIGLLPTDPETANKRAFDFTAKYGYAPRGFKDAKELANVGGFTSPSFDNDLLTALNSTSNPNGFYLDFVQLYNKNPNGLKASTIRKTLGIPLNTNYEDEQVLKINGSDLGNLQRLLAKTSDTTDFTKSFSATFGNQSYSKYFSGTNYVVETGTTGYDAFVDDPSNANLEFARAKALANYELQRVENPSLTPSQYMLDNSWRILSDISSGYQIKSGTGKRITNKSTIGVSDLETIMSNLLEQHSLNQITEHPDKAYKQGDIVLNYSNIGVRKKSSGKLTYSDFPSGEFKEGYAVFKDDEVFNINDLVLRNEDFEELRQASGDRQKTLEAIKNLRQTVKNKHDLANSFTQQMQFIATDSSMSKVKKYLLTESNIATDEIVSVVEDWSDLYLSGFLNQLNSIERNFM